jgi:hypothetical protein
MISRMTMNELTVPKAKGIVGGYYNEDGTIVFDGLIYNSVEDSYADHMNLLLRDRYKELFTLEITDYKGLGIWLEKSWICN